MSTILTPEFIPSMSTIPTKQWPWKGDKSQVTPKILVVVGEISPQNTQNTQFQELFQEKFSQIGSKYRIFTSI